MTDEQKTVEEIAEAEAAKKKEAEALNADDVITLGDEEVTPPHETESAPGWVKDLRSQHKTLKRENRELKEKLGASSIASSALGDKPTLEGCSYDNTKYEVDLGAWYEKKSELDQKQAAIRNEQDRKDQEWKNKLAIYQEKKDALKVPDYDEAESVAQTTFSTVQLGLLIDAADNPAVVIYALGKNSDRAKALAHISDPVKFVAAASKLEAQLKVSKRVASPPKPDEPLKPGSAAAVVGGDDTLKKLREEAEKSGDMSKVVAYRRQLKAQQA